MKHSLKLTSLVLFSLLAHSAATAAVGDINLPGTLIDDTKNPFTGRPETVTPGQIEQKPGTDTEAPNVDDQTEKPKLDPSLQKKIPINRIQTEGFTQLSEEELNEIIKPWEGKEATLQELQEGIVDPLTALYEKKGFITSLVFIPPQKIADGTLLIKADEGTVNEITFEKGRYFSRRAVIPRIGLRKGEIFEVSKLVKSLRRINENPDLTVDATLRAGEKPGETNIILKPQKDNFMLHVSPFYDNLGRWPIGRQRLGVTVNHNNVLGLGDTGYVSPYFTTNSFGILGGYEVPLGRHGTKLGFSAAHTQFDVDVASIPLRGKSNLYQPYISQELHRSERSLLTADLGLAVKNSSFYVADLPSGLDRLREIVPAISYRRYDKTGQLFTRHELAIGLDVLGSQITSRPGAGGTFFRYGGTLARVQKMFGDTYGIFRAAGQYTPNELASLEQFQVGGASTVRGYQEGRLIGDSGAVLSVEWHLPLKFLPDSWTIGGSRVDENVEFILFGDMGAVFDNNAFSGVNAQSGTVRGNAYALGVGGGLRVRLSKYLNARVDLGIPLLRQNPDKDVMRLHFGLESRIF